MLLSTYTGLGNSSKGRMRVHFFPYHDIRAACLNGLIKLHGLNRTFSCIPEREDPAVLGQHWGTEVNIIGLFWRFNETQCKAEETWFSSKTQVGMLTVLVWIYWSSTTMWVHTHAHARARAHTSTHARARTHALLHLPFNHRQKWFEL